MVFRTNRLVRRGEELCISYIEADVLCEPASLRNLELGGRLPINTNGGQLGEAYIHGMNGIAEGVRLIRGQSTNQPEKSDRVLVTAGTAVPTSALLLSGDA